MMREKIQETLRFLRERSNLQPTVGIILGSGLGDFAKELGSHNSIDFS